MYPTSQATDIGQPEMARVLRPGRVMTMNDVFVPEEPPPDVRAALAAAGHDYLCVATPDGFRSWRTAVGLVDVEVRDLTAIVRTVWERRRAGAGTEILLGDGPWSLGRGVRYIKVSGRKPV